jgi:ankyrin repeat protein
MPGTPPVLPIHDNTIHVMRALGYLSNKGGICSGLAYMWGQAVLAGKKEEEKFNQRIAFVNHPDFVKKINAYKKHAADVEKEIAAKKTSIRAPAKHFRRIIGRLEKERAEAEKKGNTIDENKKTAALKLYSKDLKNAIKEREAEEQLIEKLYFTDEELQLRESIAFFDSVEISQQSVQHRILYEDKKTPQQTDLSSLSLLPASLAFEAKGGMHRLNGTDGSEKKFSKEELAEQLESWRRAVIESLKDTKADEIKSGASDIIFRFGGNGHATAAKYDLAKKAWVHMDANKMPPEEIQDEKLIDRLWSAHFNEKKSDIKLSLLVYTTEDNHPAFKIQNSFDRIHKEWTDLRAAVRAGDEKKVEALIKSGADPNRREGVTGNSLMHIAVSENKLNVVNKLNELKDAYKIDVPQTNSLSQSIYEKALEKEDIPMLEALFKTGANTRNLYGSGRNIAHVVADLRSSKVATEFLSKHPPRKSYCNQLDKKKETPLEIVIRGYNRHPHKETPSEAVIRHDNATTVADVLMQLGADWKKIGADEKNILHVIAENDASGLLEKLGKKYDFSSLLHQTSKDHKTPLQSAIEKHSRSTLAELAKLGAEVQEKNHDGITYLQLAAKVDFHIFIKAFIDKTQRLLASKDNVRRQKLGEHQRTGITALDKDNQNLFHYAVLGSSAESIDALSRVDREFKLNRHQTNRNTDTPFRLAVKLKKVECVNAFIRNDHDAKQINLSGETLIHTAVESGYNDIASLVKAGADINETNVFGKTPLDVAVEKKSADFVHKLLKHGARVAPLLKPATFATLPPPLQDVIVLHCIERKNIADLKKLIALNADFSRPITGGLTALDLIAKEKIYDFFEELPKSSMTFANKHNPAHAAILQKDMLLSSSQLEFFNQPDETGKTPFFLAAERGESGVVRMALQSKQKLDTQNKAGDTVVHVAVLHNQIATLEALAETDDYKTLKEDINRPNAENKTPLQIALERNLGPMTKLLLEHGANPNDALDLQGTTPILFATAAGAVDAMEALSTTAKFDVVDKKNNTALHIASLSGKIHSLETLKKLADAGKYNSFKTDLNRKNAEGHTPLFLALRGNNQNLSAMLLTLGANLDSFPSIAELKKSKKAHPYPRPREYLLYVAAEEGLHKLAAALLRPEFKIDVNCDLYNNGRTPLAEAVWNLDFTMVKLLVEAGADYKNISPPNGLSFVTWLSENNKMDIIDMIVAKKDEKENFLNQKNWNGTTAVAYAAEIKKFDMLTNIVARGANVDLENNVGYRPIFYALDNEDLPAINFLADCINKTLRGPDNITPLFYALNKNLDVLKALLEKKFDVHEAVNGKLPIERAKELGKKEAIQALVENGALTMDFIEKKWDAAKSIIMDCDFKKDPRPEKLQTALDDFLSTALSKSDMNAILMLEKAGLNFSEINEKKQSIIHIAVIHNDDYAVIELQGIIDPACFNQSDIDGKTPLHLSAELGKEDAMEEVLDAACKIDIECKDNLGRTPLFIAIAKPSVSMAALLAAHGANISCPDKKNNTPYHIVADQKDNLEMFELLKKSDANFAVNINAENDAKEKPIDIAIGKPNIAFISRLLQEKVTLNNTQKKQIFDLAFFDATADLFTKLIAHEYKNTFTAIDILSRAALLRFAIDMGDYSTAKEFFGGDILDDDFIQKQWDSTIKLIKEANLEDSGESKKIDELHKKVFQEALRKPDAHAMLVLIRKDNNLNFMPRDFNHAVKFLLLLPEYAVLSGDQKDSFQVCRAQLCDALIEHAASLSLDERAQLFDSLQKKTNALGQLLNVALESSQEDTKKTTTTEIKRGLSSNPEMVKIQMSFKELDREKGAAPIKASDASGSFPKMHDSKIIMMKRPSTPTDATTSAPANAPLDSSSVTPEKRRH